MSVRREPGTVVIEVHGGHPDAPRPRGPDPDDEHGRGLQLVAALAAGWGVRHDGRHTALAAGWGVRHDGRHKIVWASLDLPGAES
ncbi:ATP-binding protein [Carbonactinospora thermoautotrophica]|uniref:ATP-binding protein n=1 Tax=Carbonactinospora thermoautotrophica TaxID=1469144 RepID=UPI003DA9A28C